MLHHVAQVLEIEQQARLIQITSGQGDPHLVVVSVRILALPLVIAQVVPRGERIFYRDLVHEPSRPARRQASNVRAKAIFYRKIDAKPRLVPAIGKSPLTRSSV